MGLVRASIITGLCYVALMNIWYNKYIPLDKKIKEKYDKVILLCIIFFIESLW
tara:strand:- start:15836 stop:15994 length:159 start_codon:yes stop_codon:yes gene_type:complete